jgi:exodeoxyribonuclease V gamma subunit
LSTLERLLALYREGLTRPLPFFPRAAQAFAKALNKKPGPRAKKPRTPEALLESARTEAFKQWAPDHRDAWPEAEDSWHAQAVQGVEAPLDEQFEALAKEIFLPLLGYLSEDPGAMDEEEET